MGKEVQSGQVACTLLNMRAMKKQTRMIISTCSLHTPRTVNPIHELRPHAVTPHEFSSKQGPSSLAVGRKHSWCSYACGQAHTTPGARSTRSR